jgi:hypothetical protein
MKKPREDILPEYASLKMETKYCTPHKQYKEIKKREPILDTGLTEIATNYSTQNFMFY